MGNVVQVPEWLVLIACVAIPVLLGLSALLSAGFRRPRTAERNSSPPILQEDGAARMLRLSAMELRSLALSLHGRTGQLAARVAAEAAARLTPPEFQPVPDPLMTEADCAALAQISAQLLTLTDDMQDHGSPIFAGRALKEEGVAVGTLLRDCISGLDAALAPGRRHWRIAEAADTLVLRADRRALRHVLSRVLADAVRHTRHDDWIEITCVTDATMVTLTVADEGLGLASTDASADSADTRGLPAGLALARSLMAAHGGQLHVEAATRVGTQVGLAFPTECIRAGIPAS